MGMIMIVGIVAKNGILMLDAVKIILAAGDTLREALVAIRPAAFSSGADDFTCRDARHVAAARWPSAPALNCCQPLAIGVIGGLTMALLLSAGRLRRRSTRCCIGGERRLKKA
jgi:Cu/Ag efflux pump CusA